MKNNLFITCLTTIMTINFTVAIAHAQDSKPIRRSLRIALYPYVPEKDLMYWKVERDFETANPEIDLQYIDLGYDYYSGGLTKSLQTKNIDVVEIDTVFLHDLVLQGLIAMLPSSLIPKNSDFLKYSLDASKINGVFYGVPHYVCGNFLFYDKDDPEAKRFEACNTLYKLEQIIGTPTSPSESLLIDLHGSSTLGEKYFDAVLDEHQNTKTALKYANVNNIEPNATNALNRLFSLTPGGLCDSEFHHKYGQFYAREFSRLNARVLIGYSERLHYVVDEYLHGIREGNPSRGKGNAINVGIISAPLSDNGSKMLSWVDVVALRSGLSVVKNSDAVKFVQYYTSYELNKKLLIPDWGKAPTYLLPALKDLYNDKDVLNAAPLYTRFSEIIIDATAITGPGLPQNLRNIGQRIEADGFHP